jgi:hypothetical protein
MGMAKENQFHVLAVDDSIIDRMLIERLLKTSSFQGILIFLSISFFFYYDLYFYIVMLFM